MANDGDQHDERIGQQLSVPAFPPYPPVGEKPSSQLNQPNAISIRTHHSRPSRGKVVLLIGLTLLIVGTIIRNHAPALGNSSQCTRRFCR
jgi:hypothetical protein